MQSALGIKSPFLLTVQINPLGLYASKTSPSFRQEELLLLVPLTIGNTNVSTHGPVQLSLAQTINNCSYSGHRQKQIYNLL